MVGGARSGWSRRPAFILAGVLLLAGTACAAAEGDEDGAASDESSPTMTVYSGREEELVGPLLDQFQDDSGITLEVRYGDSAELAATLLEEGDATPADAFFSQDAGALGAVAEAGLVTEVPDEITERVEERFRSHEDQWVGTSGRARVAAYNTDALGRADLPDSILEFTDPEWRGRIGFPPTNSSFQAFVAAMIVTEGEEATRTFLLDLVDNEPKTFEDNSSTVRAVAAGEIDVGFVNHYYIYEVAAEDGDIPVANHFFADGDPGALVNAAGVAILASSDNVEEAETFADYLTGEEGQTFFAEDTFEYPVVDGYEPSQDLVPLDEIEAPAIDLSDLSGTLEPALQLLAEVGLL
jgi:iron(III) transport system substrate-binding protein